MYKLNIDKSMGVATNLIVGRVQDLPYEKFSFKVYDKSEIIDLTGASIEFRGINAIGGKIVQMDVNITNAKSGEFEFEVPKIFYSTMGKFTNAYFLIKRKGRADSTEDLLINVLSGTEVSEEDAQIVIDGLDKVIEDTIEKVSKDLQIKIDKQIAEMNTKITKLDGDVKRIDKVVKDAEVKMNKLVVDTTANIEQLKKDFEAKLTQLDLKIVDFDKSIVAFEKRLQDLTALIDSKNLITQEDIARMDFVTNTQLISKRYVSESQLIAKKYVSESQLTSKNYVNNQELINMRFVKHSEMGNLLHNYPTTGFLRKNPVNDLNELKESGLFTFDVTTKNVPTTGFLTVTCKMRNNDSGSQIAESIGEVGTSKLWNRTLVDGTWSKWEPLHQLSPTVNELKLTVSKPFTDGGETVLTAVEHPNGLIQVGINIYVTCTAGEFNTITEVTRVPEKYKPDERSERSTAFGNRGAGGYIQLNPSGVINGNSIDAKTFTYFQGQLSYTIARYMK